MSRMKYIRKNGIKDPGSAITHGIALILAVVGTLPLLLKAAREPDHLHVVAMAVFMLSMILLYLPIPLFQSFRFPCSAFRHSSKILLSMGESPASRSMYTFPYS